jgi:hypothetical protein
MPELVVLVAFLFALLKMTIWVVDAGGKKKQMEMGKTKNLLLVVLFIAVVVLMFLLSRGCRSSPSADSHKKTLDSLIAANAEANRDFGFRIDSLTHEVQDKDTVIKTLHAQAKSWQKAARDQADTAKVYVNLYRIAKQELDTSAMLTNCDELANQFETIYHSYVGYMSLSDSLNSAMSQSIATRDTLIKTLKAKDSVNTKTINDLRINYGKKIVDYAKLERKRAGGRWIDRGLGLGAGVIITSILKK